MTEENTTTEVLPFQRFSADEWMVKPPDPVQLLTLDNSPCLALGSVALLTAAGGVGKTRALCQLAVSVATGVPWLGTFDVATQGGVALLCAEEPTEELHRRIYHYLEWGMKAHGWKRDTVERMAGRLVVCGLLGKTLPDMDEIGTQLGMSKHRPECGYYSLVILDPAVQFMGPDTELDSFAANQFITECRRLSSSLAGTPTVLIAHHTRKGGGAESDDARGSSAIRDGARWQMSLTAEVGKNGDAKKPTGAVLARVVKNNYGRTTDDIRMNINGEGVLIPADKPTPPPNPRKRGKGNGDANAFNLGPCQTHRAPR